MTECWAIAACLVVSSLQSLTKCALKFVGFFFPFKNSQYNDMARNAKATGTNETSTTAEQW